MKPSAAREWMPLYIANWCESAKITRMSLEAEALYMRVLMLNWTRGELPSDLSVLAGMLPARFARRLTKLWPQLTSCFVVDGDTMTNARCADELAVWNALVEKKSDAGRAGGMASTIARGQKPRSKRSTVVQRQLKQTANDGSTNPRTIAKPRPDLTRPDQTEPNQTSEEVPPNPPTGGLVAGKPARMPGPIESHWSLEYERTRGSAWAWQAVDRAKLREALKLGEGDLDGIRGRITKFMESSDPWVAANCRPAVFLTKWNDCNPAVRVLTKHERRAQEVEEFIRKTGGVNGHA